MTPVTRRRALTFLGVTGLLIVLLIQLALSVRQESQTWDEGNHIFAGYRSWTNADFGLNPEHPPLVKLLATAPLLRLPLQTPKLQDRNFKVEAFMDGKEFLYQNDADMILFRTRMAAAILTLLLALLVFLATKEMFGTGAAFIALTLLVFEPNLLAHGALVTTDAGLSCFMFATVYAFYRYVKAPSVARLLIVGVAAGLALAAKHTGLLVFPILTLLALCEVVRHRGKVRAADHRGDRGAEQSDGAVAKTANPVVRLAVALVVTGVIAVGVLWAFYGFRYDARPAELKLNPSLAVYVENLKPREAKAILTVAHWRLLPESYLYGLADVRQVADFMQTFILGKVYPHGVWFYFPVAFAVKSTLGFLILLLLAVGAVATRKLNCWREILFLTVPPVFHLAVAMSSGLNIGVRHILPLYVFLSVLIGGASWTLIRSNRRWAFVIAVLLLFHAISSLRVFPTYIPYANELWGGPANTHKYLSDSNADWAQQLKATKQYLDNRGVKNCWIAYFAQGLVDPAYYGIPCKLLPTIVTPWFQTPVEAPASIDGPVLISAGTLSGFEYGPDLLNPYDQFQKLQPTAVIQHGILVFDGHFDIPLASALAHEQHARELFEANQVERAREEAQAAIAVYPDCVQSQVLLGDMMMELKRPVEARVAYEKALSLAQTVEPEFQRHWLPGLKQKLEEIANAPAQ
ncbi:MAG TPA: glycosyltransferase family 39 protein [Pyrinomonadaceae bacterium]|jgi:4-amino-4-deoxy-L-arabinose transferase-like glycosyltransferase